MSGSIESAPPLATLPVGEIAARLPGASAIFRSCGIDFCCHGNATLAEAARARSLAPEDVEARLRELPAVTTDIPTEPGLLIDHILHRYHEKHRRDLPELIALARRVEHVHRDNPSVPQGLASFLEGMKASLEAHMFKEEMILFPVLRQKGGEGLAFPLEQMRREHDDHGGSLHELSARTADGEVPDGACPTWRALYAGTRMLTDELMEHIHLENNVLFPQFE